MRATTTNDTKNSILSRIRKLGISQRETIFSNGVISSADILNALLKNIGLEHVNVMISTWQIGIENQSILARISKNPRINMKILLDSSYIDRNKQYYKKIEKSLGHCLWMTSNHSKVMVFQSKSKNFTVLSSANFNRNFRFEFFDITESKALSELTILNFRPFFKGDPIGIKKPNRCHITDEFRTCFNGKINKR